MEMAIQDPIRETRFKTKNFLEAYRSFFSFLQPRHRKQLLILMLGSPILAALEALVLSLIAIYVTAVTNPDAFLASGQIEWLRDRGIWIPADANSLILTLSGIVIAGVLLKNACLSLFQYVMTRISESIGGYFGALFLNGAIDMPYEWHIEQNSADLATALHWRDAVGTGLVRNALMISTDVALILMMSITLLVFRPLVSLIVITSACTIGWIAFRWIGPRLDRKSLEARDLMISINKEALQIIGGVKEIKMFGSKFRLSSSVGKMQELAQAQAKKAFLLRLPRDFLEFFGVLILSGTIVGMTLLTDTSTGAIMGTVALP